MSHSDTVTRLLKIFETFNVDEAMTLFADDATYQFGNYPAAVGIDNIKATVAASHLDFIKSCSFDVKSMIEPGGGVVACEMDIIYGTTDGRTITLPCADLFRFNEQGQVTFMQIFMDAGPLFAPANA
ncbi:MAG: nuclear transport factor 2 family protein [Bryobacteraceae bacterium]|nr:nuclear transport factor 2 family protein [Bryobacteraceae bacterium]